MAVRPSRGSTASSQDPKLGALNRSIQINKLPQEMEQHGSNVRLAPSVVTAACSITSTHM